jgi:stage V sporulation protein G
VEITEVRVKLMDEPGERLRAFCSITFDDAFVVRDLKIIEGGTGPFVAMPSRKLTTHCYQCSCKNHIRASYCNQCGTRLKEQPAIKDDEGRAKLYADIAHPINSQCREMIQDRVIAAFKDELARASMPGYTSSYEDLDGGEVDFPQRKAQVSQTQVQATEKLHGPHKPPSRDTRAKGQINGDFGAGIFD